MGKYKVLVIMGFLAIFLFFGNRALADEIYLKNGRILQGIIIGQTDEGVTLQLMIGAITFNTEQIKEIEKATPEENQELRRHWQALIESRQEEIRVEKEKKKEEIKEQIAKEEKKQIPSEESTRVYTKDKRVYVDGELFYLKGIAYDINYPGCIGGMGGYYRIPFEVFEKDFKMMEEAGINCLRTYEPLPPELLDLAEKHNIMVIENIVYLGDWTDYKSAEELKALKEEAIRIVQRDKDRPCILMWSIWNDAPFAWGKHGGNIVKRYGFETVNNFLKEIYLAVKAEDENHLVTGSNMLGHIGTEIGFDFLDVIGANAYIGEQGQWLGVAKTKESIKELAEISEKYNKPVVILETGYSTYINEELQYEVLKAQIEITNQHIAGIVIFQWSDGWWKAGEPSVHDDHIEEYWGILTGYREPKVGYEAIFEMFNSIPTKSKGYSSSKQETQ